MIAETSPREPAAAPLADEEGRVPASAAENRGAPAVVLPSGEVRGSGAGAGGGGAPEDPDTDDPTLATPSAEPAEHHPEAHGDGPNYGSA